VAAGLLPSATAHSELTAAQRLLPDLHGRCTSVPTECRQGQNPGTVKCSVINTGLKKSGPFDVELALAPWSSLKRVCTNNGVVGGQYGVASVHVPSLDVNATMDLTFDNLKMPTLFPGPYTFPTAPA